MGELPQYREHYGWITRIVHAVNEAIRLEGEEYYIESSTKFYKLQQTMRSANDYTMDH